MPALDGLRGIAILMIVFTHSWTGWVSAMSIYKDTSHDPYTFLLPTWLDKLASSAVHGVTLFFIVSAFTLTVRFAQDQNVDLRHYALRRLARIGPAYWLAGLCYAFSVGLGPRYGAPDGMSTIDVLIAAVFGSAWQGGAAGAVVPGGWSISCEFAFYAALPIIMGLIRRRIWGALALTFLSVLAAQFVARDGVATYTNPIVQAPVFLFGVTAAIMMMHVQFDRHDHLAIAFLAAAIVVVPFSPIDGWFVLKHVQFGSVVAFAVALAAVHPPRVLACLALRRIGEVSFSMYLLHFAVLAPCLYISTWLVHGNGWPTFAMQFALTSVVAFACGCVTHKFIEQPAIRWAATYTRRIPNSVSLPAE